MTPHDLSDLIGHIYDCALEPTRWDRAIERIAGSVEATAGVVALHDLEADRGVRLFACGFPRAIVQLYGSRLSTVNPIARVAATRVEGQIDTLASMFEDDSFRRSAVHRFMLRPLGLRHVLGMAVLRSQQRGVWLGVFRPAQRADFGRAEIETFQLLAPHVIRAVRISDLLDLQTVTLHRLTAVIDRLTTGVFLLDDSAAVVHFNAAAQAMLRRGGLLALRQGRLVATTPAARLKLAAAMTAAAAGDFAAQPAESAIALGDGEHRAIATVLPLGHDREGPSAAAAVFVQRAGHDPAIPLEAFGALYGLTAAELRVLHALMQGHSLVEAAAALGVGQPTAKTHLSKIFSKTGTSRQSELMRLVLASAAPLRP